MPVRLPDISGESDGVPNAYVTAAEIRDGRSYSQS
jgi:hypothetical protein